MAWKEKKKETPVPVKTVVTITKETCRDCFFFRVGWCRRFPQGTTKSYDDWCGEYKKKEDHR